MFVSDLQLPFLAWLEPAISILERLTSYERGLTRAAAAAPHADSICDQGRPEGDGL